MKIEELKKFIKTNIMAKDGIKINAKRSEAWLKDNHPSILKEINSILPNIKAFSNKIKIILNREGIDKCDLCDNNITENKLRYDKFLCDGCFIIDIRKRTEETNIQKYGVKAPAMNESIKEITKNTIRNKYGVAHHTKLDFVQDKKKKTNLEKYGVESHSQLQSSRISSSKMKKNQSFEQLSDVAKYYVDNIHELYEKYVNEKLSMVRLAEISEINVTTLTRLFKDNDFEMFRKPVSGIESSLYYKLKNSFNDVVIEQSNRSIISPKEIDIFFPEFNIGIEINGWYWHSVDTTSIDKRHKQKYILCKDRGVTLLQFWDYEVDLNYDKVLSIIKSKIGKNEKIYARNCEIKLVENAEYANFCELFHLQGYGIAKHRYGLFHKNELVSIMSFSKSRYSKDCVFEMVRFCNKSGYTVIGGASKLFKRFLKDHNSSVVSYADARISNGNLYETLGFKLVGHSDPNYFYIKKYGIAESRIKFQKHKLKDILEKYDSDVSEKQNLINNGYRILYDCGNLVYKYTIS